MQKRTLFFYTLMLGSIILVSCDSSKKKKNDGHQETHSSKAPSSKFIKDPEKLKVIYPQTRTGNVSDVFFGTSVADPYRWLEDPEGKHTAEIDKWVESQRSLTQHYVNGIPYRKAVSERLTKLWDYERYSAPYKEGDFYYYYKNDGLQEQAVLYQQTKLDGEAKVFIDPNKLSEDGTISLGGLSFSKDGKYAAYMISGSGSDWKTVKVKDTKTGQDLDDVVDWLRYSGVSWYKDGFYYSRYDANDGGDKYTGKNEFHQVYYHKLGTPQSEDQLFYKDNTNPERRFGVAISEDESLLYLYANESTSGNALSVQRMNMDKEGASLEPIMTSMESDFYPIDNNGEKILVLTNYKAPKYRLIEVDLNTPAESKWKDIIPESEHVLESVSVVGGKIAAKYLVHASSLIKFFEPNGKFLSTLNVPLELGIGQNVPASLSGIVGKKSDTQAFFTVSSYTLPTSICKIDMKTLKTTIWKTPTVDFNNKAYKTDQVSYKSKDGTEVRMFITYKHGIKKDGSNPLLMYGYGGFNISLTPGFSLTRLPFLEQGGIYVVVNLRGGGEYGEEWHKAGTKMQKQNVFDDFIAAGEYLIKEGYTSKEKLAIQGGSNGGLLVGACMTQRPDLFKVALPAVGVMDMLRYHKFTIGSAWAGDYGTSEDSKEQFEYLLDYSPVHNAKPQEYPATMISTSDHDDRVVPAHSYKFAAGIQANQKGQAPILLRVTRKAGHGAGKSTSQTIEEATDQLSFMMFNLGIKKLQ